MWNSNCGTGTLWMLQTLLNFAISFRGKIIYAGCYCWCCNLCWILLFLSEGKSSTRDAIVDAVNFAEFRYFFQRENHLPAMLLLTLQTLLNFDISFRGKIIYQGCYCGHCKLCWILIFLSEGKSSTRDAIVDAANFAEYCYFFQRENRLPGMLLWTL
jgi:hypothetical protein